MNEIELNHYRKLFGKKSIFLSSKKDIQLKVRYIEKLVLEDIPYIWLVYGLIKDENVTVRSKAVEAIVYFFDKLETQNELYSCLKHLEINIADLKYYKKEFPSDIYIKFLIISSFNRNGYIREQAIKDMGRTDDKSTIKYLLMRLGDWVAAVRESATIALRSFLKSDFRDFFISNLEVIQNLANIRRTDLKNIQDEIFTFIYGESLDTINGFNDKIRLIYFRHLLLQPDISNQIIDIILFDRNCLIRNLLLKNIAQYDLTDRKYIIEHALKDSSARVRLNALFAVNEFVEDFKSIILALVSDVSATIRYIARKLLGKDRSDYRTIYYNNIACNRNLLGNLFGLVDLIENEDITIFESYISHPSSKVKLSCLIAISKIDSVKAYNYAIASITNSNTAVRNKIGELLSQYSDKGTILRLREIYKDSDFGIKETILSIYNRIGGYPIIGDLIYALQEEDVRIVDQAWLYIFKWRAQATSLYSLPTKVDLERTKNIYSKIDKDKSRMSSHQKKVWEELPFFLR